MLFFSNDPATTLFYTLSLHDALPISGGIRFASSRRGLAHRTVRTRTTLARVHDPAERILRLVGHEEQAEVLDRKSTRLNSSHRCISYAVFCLKKKKK